MTWTIRVPATSANLGPGYDRLGLALPLWLTVKVKPAQKWQLHLEGFGSKLFPANQNHSLVQYYRKACDAWSLQRRTFSVEVTSEIPVSSGLGSSAAIIVAALALAQISALGSLDLPSLSDLAAELEGHADNTIPAIFGGLQDTELGQLPIHSKVRILCVTSEQQANTKLMRELVPKEVNTQVESRTNELRGQLIIGLKDAETNGLRASSQDIRHQPYRLAVQPHARSVFEFLNEEPGIHGVFLSGSGPTVSAWVLDDDSIDSDIVMQRMKQKGVAASQCLILSPDLKGLVVRGDDR